MKRTILLVLCMMAVMAMNAGDVTPNEALQKATQFVNNRIAHGHGPRLAPGAQPRLTLASRVSGLYVYNVQNKGGFVIVSPDDETETILGYSDSGEFDESHMPDNMRYWLQGYAEEIAFVRGTRYEVRGTEDVRGTRYEVRGTEDVRGTRYEVRGTANAPAAASTIKTSIAPLIQTHWNQSAPYNNLTPLWDGSSHSATGCVATAMAQVMYFTEMRVESTTTTTTTEIPGYTSKQLNKDIDPIPVGTEINWSNMQLTYPSTGTDAEKEAADEAIAQLMYYCGVSVGMNYYQQSGANSNAIVPALKNYFGYNTTTQQAIRSDYTYGDWINLIYFELSQGRPVLYGGQSNGGGHAFICDGYDMEDYFHINWGWGGQSDGCFKLSVLNPQEQGIGGSSSTDGYHYGQVAIIGIQKLEESGEMSDIQKNTGFVLSCTKVTFSENPTVGKDITATLTITNSGSSDYDGDINIGFINGTDVEPLGGNTFYIPAGSTKECTLTFTTRYVDTLPVRVFLLGENDIVTYIDNGQPTPLTIGNGNSSTNNVELTATVSVNTAEATGQTASFGSSESCPVYNIYGTTFKGTITLTNATSTDYTGTFAWALIPNAESGAVNQVSVTVPANSSYDIPVEMKGLDLTKQYILSSCYIKNNAYTSWNLHGFYNLKPGITVYAADGTENTTKATGEFVVPDDVLAIDLTGTGVTTVTPNGKKNCLYFIGSEDTTPNGLEDANIVKGGTAEQIKLTDENDFYSPKDFTAQNVTFTYNNTKQADGVNGWNTLILPFNVTKVTADDTEIDWFHSSTDTGKNFWVKEFTGDDADQVYFDFTEEMKANTPYIVALPGNKWGADWDMSNKTIQFIGENVTVSNSNNRSILTGSNYRFIGNMKKVSVANVYAINEAGDAFEVVNSGNSPAFRAYFKADTFDRTVTSLGINSGFGGGTTGLDMTTVNRPQTTDGSYYDLSGRRVEKPTKGLYIVNGKKVIIK